MFRYKNIIMEKIWNFLNSKVFLYILVGLVIMFFIGTLSQNSNLKDDIERHNQNIIAMNDTISEERQKNGDLQVSIDGYVAEGDELKKINKDLYDKVENQEGKVITLSNAIFFLKQDTAELRKALKNAINKPAIKENDSLYHLGWVLPYQYDSLNYDIFTGNTSVILSGDESLIKKISVINHSTEIIKRESQIDLTFGQKEEDGRIRVFAQSKYPGFTAKSLKGVYVDYPKKKHWFQGWSVGIGSTVGWDVYHGRTTIVIGPTISYSIYQW